MDWWGSALWGINSWFHAIRACKLPGWSPKKEAKDHDDDISEVASAKAKDLSFMPGYAAKGWVCESAFLWPLEISIVTALNRCKVKQSCSLELLRCKL